MAFPDKPVELSEQVLESVKTGQQAAIEAVRKFVATVEELVPLQGASQRRGVIDSALEMADRLVETQYDFVRSVVRAAGTSLGASNDESRTSG
ncbi:MAG: hypothetical protein ACLP8S_20095 [Solirubrobacteraceae bacterium]